jgi:hypothetical protein
VKSIPRLVVIGLAFFGVQVSAADPGLVVLRALAETPAPAPGANGDDDRALFEMCCHARGRAGFSHCVEYGACVERPEAVCIGRGPAEGMRMVCGPDPEVPPDGDGEEGSRRPGSESGGEE